MRNGLVDGQRLRKEQYIAMKDRDAAFRLFISARQKYFRKNKDLVPAEGRELVLPPLRITEIDDEVFQGWIDEV